MRAGFVTASILVLILSAPAWAQMAADAALCTDAATPSGQRVAACTAEIQSGRYSGRNLAILYVGRGNAYHARREWDPATADFSQAITLDPEFGSAYFSRGLNYRESGKPDLAISDYSRAIEIEPQRSDAYNGRGNAYNAKKQFDQALADYNKALQLDPKNASIYNNRGNAYLGKTQYDLVEADYSKALEINPDMADAWNGRGALRSRKNQVALARADFSKAIELNPKLAQAYANRGINYRKARQFDLALIDLSKAIELEPEKAGHYTARADLFDDTNRRELAIADYTRALALQPADANLLNMRCWDEALTGAAQSLTLQNALFDCRHSLSVRPGDAATLDSLGMVYLKLNDNKAALDSYNDAVKAGPKSASSRWARGLIKRRLGDTKGADADQAAARKIDAKIAATYAGWGVVK